jgi:hypothetical protein
MSKANLGFLLRHRCRKERRRVKVFVLCGFIGFISHLSRFFFVFALAAAEQRKLLLVLQSSLSTRGESLKSKNPFSL